MIEFTEFWNTYPRKVGRVQAERTWRRMTDGERWLAVRTVPLWEQTVQWQSGGGLFIPHGSTFLNQKRYLDEPWTGAFEEEGIDPKKA